MSNEPFRMSRPVNRGGEGEPELAMPEEKPESPAVHRESKPVHHRPTRRHVDEKPPTKKIVTYVVAAVATGVIIALVAWLVMTAASTKATGIDAGKYQAVFFTNGQVYFGKLQHFSSGYLRLTDVYYLQTQSADSKDSTNPQQAADSEQSTTLIKLGEEIHGPEDEMIISEEQVLFYENLKKDGKVSQSIEQHKSKK